MTHNWKIAIAAITVLLMGHSAALSMPQEETIYDQETKLVSFEDLSYPAVARVTRVQGVVVVRLKLDEEGRVLSAFAISRSKSLIPDTVSNAKKWRFEPSPRKSAVLVYEFRLTDGACHENSHSLFELVHPNFASITACSPVIDG